MSMNDRLEQSRQSAEAAAHESREAARGVRQDLRDAAHDAAQGAREAGHYARESAEHAGQTMAAAAGHARDAARSGFDRLKENISEAADVASTKVHDAGRAAAAAASNLVHGAPSSGTYAAPGAAVGVAPAGAVASPYANLDPRYETFIDDAPGTDAFGFLAEMERRFNGAVCAFEKSVDEGQLKRNFDYLYKTYRRLTVPEVSILYSAIRDMLKKPGMEKFHVRFRMMELKHQFLDETFKALFDNIKQINTKDFRDSVHAIRERMNSHFRYESALFHSLKANTSAADLDSYFKRMIEKYNGIGNK